MHLDDIHPDGAALRQAIRHRLPEYLRSGARRRQRRRNLCDRFTFDLGLVIWRYRSCFLLDHFVIESGSLAALLDDLRVQCPSIADLQHVRVIPLGDDHDGLIVAHKAAMMERLLSGMDWLPSVVFVDIDPGLPSPKVVPPMEICDELDEILMSLASALQPRSVVVEMAFQASTLSLSSICGLVLGYPVCYILRRARGNSFRANCLGNVPIVVIDVALDLRNEIVTMFSYSCPVEFCNLIQYDDLSSRGFLISSRIITAAIIPL